jgi:two-component system OmpR family sensor kinase
MILPRSLYGRLAATLFILLTGVGLAMVAITHHFSELYQEEAAQRLNGDLARHIVAERLLIRNGRGDEGALKEIFDQLMIINPSIELYLIDPQGRLLAYSAPPGRIKRTRIDMAPVRDFLSGRPRLPILGDDPRDAASRKIFSVAPVQGGQGYLYIVLAGEQFTTVAQRLQGSYVMRESAWTIAFGIVAAFIAGLVALFGLTRRLRRLTVEVERFKRDDLREQGHALAPASDEIAQLASCFRQMSQRIERQMEAMEQADELRRERVAKLSHDLRTSLTSLHGYLETLQTKFEGLSAAEKRQFLDTAVKHSRRLARLVSDFFELAKLEYRVAVLEREPFSISELAQDLIHKFQPLARARGIRLALERNGNADWVSADVGMIERVLTNLVDNALKFTGAGGHVSIRLDSRGDCVQVAVADTGRGILPEDLSHLFDPDYRVSHRGPHSAGLGLAISRQILELHGSVLQVDSMVGVGTRFAFSLPFAAAPGQHSRRDRNVMLSSSPREHGLTR